MIFTKSQVFKLLFFTLTICCLFNAIDAGKLPKITTKSNGTEITTSESIKTEVEVIKPEENKTKNKSNKEDDDDDDEEDEDDDVEDNDEDDDSVSIASIAEKTAVQPAADTSLSVWRIVRGFWNWIKDDISESLFGDDGTLSSSAVSEGRTFGKIRRLQMALIPIMFKFGVLSAMVAFLVAVGLKTLFLVKILIAMNLLAILAKFFTLKTDFGHVEHVAPPTWNWTPYANNGWQSSAPEHASHHHANKEIHLHIHGASAVQPPVSGYTSYSNVASANHANGWERRNDPYSAYETMALQGQQSQIVPNELSDNAGLINNVEQYNIAPSNHRMF